MRTFNRSLLVFCIYLFIIKCEETKDDSEKLCKSLEYKQYLEVISESQIFYKPNTNIPVPLISREGVTDAKGSKGVYGMLPCHCDSGSCECCVDIKFKMLNVRENGCIRLFTKDESPGVFTRLTMNGRSMLEQRLTFENPVPLCLPFPPFPAISICITVSEVTREGWNIKTCAAIELRITGTLQPLWQMRFTCIKIGFSGISFSSPNASEPQFISRVPTTATNLPIVLFFLPVQESQESPMFFYPNYHVPIIAP